ncbi:hypothetical protein [Oceanobacillus jeddahense]|uniref:Uncharacterized protein n=1 Tax=Oceanobacillus jeddahense TaxID=1462527 RepID=A0ABY5JS33_9BACI|nr:hypothetical protein [Oceanobacillus jeddahense]UUI01419.1 hypothetical protein NP439_15315 [Oceanobacillus jeddahense]
MNEDYNRFRMEEIKQNLDFINHEGWKYGSLNKYKYPFYKTFFSKFLSRKRTIDNFENELETRPKEG